MSPQFVDFDGDGHLDIVAGIFDGSPHIALGDGKHWAQPQQILDKEGQRIVMNMFWNFDAKKWDETKRCDPEGEPVQHGHLTSAIAFDWDRDGDLDLLLGDHDSGQVMLRRNEGTNAEPSFATRNEVVKVGGKPLVVPGTVTTLRAVDWTGDGQLDLLFGGMGDAYQGKTGGGVYVSANLGGDGEHRFGELVTLIAPSSEVTGEPARPIAGLYMDAADHDGDGDLDLIVGGYTMWNPPAKALDDGQAAELEALRAKSEQLTTRFMEMNAEMLKATSGLDPEAARQRRAELLQSEERVAVNKARAEAARRIEELAPAQKRDSFVWLYENLTKTAAKSIGRR